MMAHRSLCFALVACCWMAFSGCNSAMNQYAPAVKLDNAMRGFHSSMVWQRYDDASAYVPMQQRPAFLEYYESQVGEFYITEYEINRLELSDKEDLAKAFVVLSWYRLPSMSIQTTTLAETWTFREVGQRWEVTRQEAQPGPASHR